LAIKTPPATGSTLAPLEWESQHFGIRAAQVTSADLADGALADALQGAREGHFQLVVWPADAGRTVPDALLSQFGGSLVDRKATFVKLLQSDAAHVPLPRPNDPSVVSYAADAPSPALIELAIVAGKYSRFRVDQHFSTDRFEAMYHVWIERSVNRQMADEVLVIPAEDGRDDACERPLGFITLSEKDGAASIGLVAVAAHAQGRGFGTALMRAAHQWMLARGAREARVVTQLANGPACRLYEKAGYLLSAVQHYYHFWL
jgi:ribosomal protein S18 acetylase RimI-like enzyme